LDGTLTTLETQREHLQDASTNMDVLRVMQQAAGALKKTNKDLDVDQVHDIMDEIDEQNTIAEEISNAMAQFGHASDINDADLERELELMVENQVKEDITHIDPFPNVPINPITVKSTKTQEKLDGLRELEA